MEMAGKRATIYFDPEIHRALKLKAAETERTLSDLVNEAVRESLAEDLEDIEAYEARVAEPSIPFDEAVKDLKKRGLL
jgi:hypothetical protein